MQEDDGKEGVVTRTKNSASGGVLDQNKHGMQAMKVLGTVMALGVLAIALLAVDSEGLAGSRPERPLRTSRALRF